MKYLSVSQTAERWGITRRRIQRLCNEGRVEGAVKIGSYWAIPEDAEKPKDARIRSGTLNAEEIILLGVFDTSSKENAIRDILDMIPTVKIESMRDQLMGIAMKLDRMKDSEFAEIDLSALFLMCRYFRTEYLQSSEWRKSTGAVI